MLAKLILGLPFCILLSPPATAQNRAVPELATSTATTQKPDDVSVLVGRWTYRSYVNTTDEVAGDKDKALGIIFGEGIFTFDALSGTALTGSLDMGSGYVLDLKGTVTHSTPISIAVSGYGRAGTPTAGWEYDYNASLAYQWPHGVNQAPALTGTVIRAKVHDNRPAGVVASFVAVKQP